MTCTRSPGEDWTTPASTPVLGRPLLMSRYGEGNPGLATVQWLAYSAGLRAIGFRNVFHRGGMARKQQSGQGAAGCCAGHC
eukprot:11189978-Lingulodinium_polyedra.AAC.1